LTTPHDERPGNEVSFNFRWGEHAAREHLQHGEPWDKRINRKTGKRAVFADDEYGVLMRDYKTRTNIDFISSRPGGSRNSADPFNWKQTSAD